MLILKYKLIEEGMFIQMEDLVRIWRKIFAISSVKIEWTKERNSKELLFFSKRPSLGVESKSEFIAFSPENMNIKEVRENLEYNLPSWIEIVSLKQVEGSENPLDKKFFAQYKVSQSLLDENKNKIDEFFASLEKEEKSLVLSFEVGEDCLVILASEDVNILNLVSRVLAAAGLEDKHYKLTKEETYHKVGGSVEIFE